MSRATKHSAVLMVAFAITSILNYAFGVGLSWYFSPDQFGVLGVAQSLLLLTALAVGAGFPWIPAQDLAGRGLGDETRRRFRTAWIFNIGLGVLLAAGLWMAYASGVLPLGPAYRQIVPLISLTTVFLAIRAVINGAARGLHKFVPVAINIVGDATLKVAIGISLVAMGVGVAGVITGFAAATAIALIHSLWIVRPQRLWRGKGWLDRQVLQTTGPLFLSMFGPALILNLDILGLKILAPGGQGDELAGLYQAVVILARMPVFVAQSLTLVLFSYAAKATGVGGEGAGDLLKAAIKVWTRLLLPGALVLILTPQAVMRLFFPDEYHQATLALQIAVVGGLLLALMTLLNGVFQASGDRRRPAIVAGLAMLVQISVLIVLVPDYGVNAAAFSLLAAGAIGAIGLLPLTFTRVVIQNENLLNMTWRQISRVGIPLLALAVVVLLLPESNRMEAFSKLLVGGMIYLISLLRMHFEPDPQAERPVRTLVVKFVNVLMGG